MTHDYSLMGLFAILMGHASLCCLIAWLWTRHPLLTAWFLFSIAGFAAGLLGVVTDSWNSRRDPIALFVGLFLNLLPLVVYLVLRMSGGG